MCHLFLVGFGVNSSSARFGSSNKTPLPKPRAGRVGFSLLAESLVGAVESLGGHWDFQEGDSLHPKKSSEARVLILSVL